MPLERWKRSSTATFTRRPSTEPAVGLAIVALCLCAALTPRVPLAAQTPPTFYRDVAPIVRDRCTSCHRVDGPAPFPLFSYDDVARRGTQIRQVIATRYMPPWQPEQGRELFEGARRLTSSELDTMLRWIDRGMPPGEAREHPPSVSEDLETARKPDLVVTAEASYALSADGPDVFRNFVLPVSLRSARYIRAVRIQPGELRVVHHASLGIDRTHTARRLDAMSEAPGFEGMLNGAAASPPGHFIGWAPGRQETLSPPGLSWRLDPGADLVLQVHMVPSGKPELIRPSVALFFTDEPPRMRAVLVRLGSTNIDIPPRARRHVVEDTFELPVGVSVLGISPHAHYLAREIESVATLPDGRVVPLLTIRSWSFRWQDDYRYVAPLHLPRSTKITTRVAYDNTSQNIFNRHVPPRRVTYGPSTSDEMGDVWLQVVPDSDADATRLAQALANREMSAQVSAYRRLSSAQPADPLLRLTLATLYLQAGRLIEAVDELDRVLSIAPSLTIALYNRGVALQRAGRLTDAERDFRDALARDPGYAEAEHALGHVRLAGGGRREAEQHFARAVALWPEFADAWSSLATVHASGGDTDRAIEAYRRAVDVSPDHREALNNLGILMARRGQVSEAIALLERAVAAHPDDEPSRQNLAAARAMKP